VSKILRQWSAHRPKSRAFNAAFIVLQRRIALLLNLPFDKLEKLALQKELDQIGRTGD